MTGSPKHRLLVIGYGNTLRNDDGVGPRTVEALHQLHIEGVETLVCPLLTPEIADPISRAERVVFVDASVDSPQVQLRPLEPADSSQIMAHAADPRTMLAISRDVFGHTPRAWWLTIPAHDMAIGEVLTPAAQAGMQEALALLPNLVNHAA